MFPMLEDLNLEEMIPMTFTIMNRNPFKRHPCWETSDFPTSFPPVCPEFVIFSTTQDPYRPFAHISEVDLIDMFK